MYIHRLRRTTMGNGGSMTKKIFCGGAVVARPMCRCMGSGIKSEVYENQAVRPTDVLRNVRVAKSRLPKKYITFE